MTDQAPQGRRIIVNLTPRISAYLEELLEAAGGNITLVVSDALALLHLVSNASEPGSRDADMRTVIITRATEPLTLTVHPRNSQA